MHSSRAGACEVGALEAQAMGVRRPHVCSLPPGGRVVVMLCAELPGGEQLIHSAGQRLPRRHLVSDQYNHIRKPLIRL